MHDIWSSLCFSDVNVRFKCECIVTIILGYQWAAYSNLLLISFKWKSFSEVIGPDFVLESIEWYELRWVFWFVSGVGLIDEPAMWLCECPVSWYHVGKTWRQVVVFTLFQSSSNEKPTEQIWQFIVLLRTWELVEGSGSYIGSVTCCHCWTLLLPTDAHNVKKHRVIKTF